jgi:Mycobacterium membrane protein
MSTLIGRAWVPMVMVLVVAVRSLTVSRLRGVFGSYVSFPDSGTADLIIQFEPTRVICEVSTTCTTTAQTRYGWRGPTT